MSSDNDSTYSTVVSQKVGLTNTSYTVNGLRAGKYKVTITAKDANNNTTSVTDSFVTYSAPPLKVFAVPGPATTADISIDVPTFALNPKVEMATGYEITWDGIDAPVLVPPLIGPEGSLQFLDVTSKTDIDTELSTRNASNYGAYRFRLPLASYNNLSSIKVKAVNQAGTNPIATVNSADLSELPESSATPAPTTGISLSATNDLSMTFPTANTYLTHIIRQPSELESEVDVSAGSYLFTFMLKQDYVTKVVDQRMNFDNKSNYLINTKTDSNGGLSLKLPLDNATLYVDSRVSVPTSIDVSGIGEPNEKTQFHIETANTDGPLDLPAPKNVSARNITSTSALITWSAPIQGSSYINGYKVNLYSGTYLNLTLVESFDVGNVNKYQLTGLLSGDKGRDYTVVVTSYYKNPQTEVIIAESTNQRSSITNDTALWKLLYSRNTTSFTTVGNSVKKISTLASGKIPVGPDTVKGLTYNYCLDTDTLTLKFLPAKSLGSLDTAIGYAATFGRITLSKTKTGTGYSMYSPDSYFKEKASYDSWMTGVAPLDGVDQDGKVTIVIENLRKKLLACKMLEPKTVYITAKKNSSSFTIVDSTYSRAFKSSNSVPLYMFFADPETGRQIPVGTYFTWSTQKLNTSNVSYKETYTATGGSGSGAKFTVNRGIDSISSVEIFDRGAGYKDGDILTITTKTGDVISITFTAYTKLLLLSTLQGSYIDPTGLTGAWTYKVITSDDNKTFTFSKSSSGPVYKFSDDYSGYVTILDPEFLMPNITIGYVFRRKMLSSKEYLQYAPSTVINFNYAINDFFRWNKSQPFNIDPFDLGLTSSGKATKNYNATIGPYWWLDTPNMPEFPVDIPRGVSIESITTTSAKVMFSPPLYSRTHNNSVVAAVVKKQVAKDNIASNGKLYIGFKPKYDYIASEVDGESPKRVSTNSYPTISPEASFTAAMETGYVNITGLSPDTEYVLSLYTTESNIIRPATYTFRTLISYGPYSAPTNVAVTASATTAVISWTAPQGVTGNTYKVLLSGPLNGGCGRFTTTGTTLSLSNLLPNNKYIAKIFYAHSDGKMGPAASTSFTTGTL